ncbi:MAG: hypothetical protein M1822_010257 [Bathelium mastoideum]|nr:MAG: hypothetical protein M1822_010257 [Bathelium mastoideum]
MAQQQQTSVKEVVESIHRLYQPGSRPDEIEQIQNTLQTVQRSPEGWQLADALLDEMDTNLRFFGALTYMVKIKQTASFDEAQVTEILEKLLNWTKLKVPVHCDRIVANKLCSTLVTFFLRPDVNWTRCVLHLMYTLCTPSVPVLSEQAISERLDAAVIMSHMTLAQGSLTLEFATTLTDEADKIDTKSPLYNTCREKIQANVPHVAALLRFAFSRTEYQVPALRCFTSWAIFARTAWMKSSETRLILQNLLEFPLKCLTSLHTRSAAVTALREIIDHAPEFLLKDYRVALLHIMLNNTAPHFLDFSEESEFDHSDKIQFVLFLLSFANEIVEDLVVHIQDDAHKALLDVIHQLSTSPQIQDYSIHTGVALFWTSFAEFIVDELPSKTLSDSELGPIKKQARLSHILKACEGTWAKARYSCLENDGEWDSDDLEGLFVFRHEVADLLRLANTLVPQWVLPDFSGLALNALSNQKWMDLEACLWAMTTVADSVQLTLGNKDSIALKTVMESSIFSTVLSEDTKNAPGLGAMTIDLLGKYSKYFVVYPEHLLSALRFLFGCLQCSPETATTIALSVAELCSNCRTSLVTSIGSLMEQYGSIRNWPTTDTSIKRHITKGLAAVVQATAPKFHGLDALLAFVEEDIEIAVQSCLSKDYHRGEDHALSALGGLWSIAQGLEAPLDAPIDLEEPEDPHRDSQSYVQQRICTDIGRAVRINPTGDVIEAACALFKTGFRHRTGPFAFPAAYSIDFILQSDVNTPRLEDILSMGSNLMVGNKLSSEQVATLLNHVAQMMQALEAPSKDPEIAQGLIDMTLSILRYEEGGLIPSVPPLLLNLIFDFGLKSLAGPDIMPKRAAADFWGTILTLPDALRAPLLPLVGPPLANTLTAQITTHATRSALDALIPPLRHLLQADPRAPSWFAAALVGDPQLAAVDLAVQQRFLAQLGLAARGGGGGARVVGRVVREFWAACHGTVAGLGRLGGAWSGA